MKKSAFWIVAALGIGVLVVGLFAWNRGGEDVKPAQSLNSVDFTSKDAAPAEVFTVSAEQYLSEATDSSHLDYDAVNHLAYNPEYAKDGYWDTAWCSAEPSPSWTLQFDQGTDLGNVGIVPGYAKSEAAFFENNRMKTLAVFYDGSLEAAQTLSFEDRYGMQFFALNVRGVSSIRLQILETYPGSKYKDNCLSEVDFWSFAVRTTDAQMALDDQARLSPQSKVCENGNSYNDERVDTAVLSPKESTVKGRHYQIDDWGVGFWIPPEYADYTVFQSEDSLEFSTETDPGCLPYGDAIGAYLSRLDTEENFSGSTVPDYMTKGSFQLGAISGNTYREEWFGGDILIYSFDLKNTAFTADSLACPLDATEDCSIRNEAFIRSLLVTLE
jgi:hypothetical protein